MSEFTQSECDTDEPGRCSLCGDVAIEMTVVSVDRRARLARVRSDSQEMEVAIDLIDAIHEGDRVMVHQGFALSRVGET